MAKSFATEVQFRHGHRFAIYRVAQGDGSARYLVADAYTVTDADVRAGKAPAVVCEAATLAEADAYCDAHRDGFEDAFFEDALQAALADGGDSALGDEGSLAYFDRYIAGDR